MKYTPGPHTIDHNNGYQTIPIKDRYYCKGQAAQIMIHENHATLFRPDAEFNFFQVPSEQVVIGIVWIKNVELAVALWTKSTFIDFFSRVNDGKEFFQTILVDKTEATKIFTQKEKP